MKSGVMLAAGAALMLSGCGDSITAVKENAAAEAKQIIDETQVAEMLTDEARFVVGTFEQDIRSQIAAHKAQFGALPTSVAELKALAAPSALATAAVTDALAEQLPFVRRETLEQMSAHFVAATEKRIFEQAVAAEAAVGEAAAR
jgi:hypothetical protein